MKGRVLVVEDDVAMRQLLVEELGASGLQCVACGSAAEALSELQGARFDVMISDLNLGGTNGIELCAQALAIEPDLPFIVITAFGSMETAVAAIRAGAYDFITKPFDTDQLLLTLERAVRLRRLSDEVVDLRRRVGQPERFKALVGESPAMRQLRATLDQVADATASVLIRGESGTGKEVAARAIHAASRRRDAPFVAVNMAAMPSALLESELFGHLRGAFTDARGKRDGLFMRANGGTLLLDEIGEMPMELQPKLLRALEERTIRPVGSDREVPVDVRVIAATHRDLEAAVEEGSFRGDLYFRLNVLDVSMPPLRARGRDVLLLAQTFLERFAKESGKPVRGIDRGAAARLLAYPWPGNVRELRNCMERAVALCRQEDVVLADLPERIQQFEQSHVVVVADSPEDLVPLEVVERRYILRVLEAVQGNKTLAAKILGLGRKTLYRKLEQYGTLKDA